MALFIAVAMSIIYYPVRQTKLITDRSSKADAGSLENGFPPRAHLPAKESCLILPVQLHPPAGSKNPRKPKDGEARKLESQPRARKYINTLKDCRERERDRESGPSAAPGGAGHAKQIPEGGRLAASRLHFNITYSNNGIPGTHVHEAADIVPQPVPHLESSSFRHSFIGSNA